MQGDGFVFGARDVVAADKRSSIHTSKLLHALLLWKLLQYSDYLLDHVSSIGPGAAAAVGAQQAVDVSRIVGGEIGGVGPALQTHQPVVIT